MNNADLIERLRRNPRGCVFELEHTVADALAAADKQIAELEAERDEWQRGEGCAMKAWGKAECKLAIARDAMTKAAYLECNGVIRVALAQIGGDDAGD